MKVKGIITQVALADLLDQKKTNVNTWFKNNAIPEKYTIRLLEIYKDINPDWLLFGEGEMLRERETPGSRIDAIKYLEKVEEVNKLLREKMELKDKVASYEKGEKQLNDTKETA